MVSDFEMELQDCAFFEATTSELSQTFTPSKSLHQKEKLLFVLCSGVMTAFQSIRLCSLLFQDVSLVVQGPLFVELMEALVGDG